MKSTIYTFSLQKHIVFSIIIINVIFVSAEWSRIGLENIKVTSIVGGRVFNSPMLLAGTDSLGVYSKMGDETFRLLTDFGSTTIPDGLKNINALYLAKSIFLVAGSDSGLYVYTFTSGVPPRWTKIDAIHQGIYAIAGVGDTIFAATRTDVYRSLDNQFNWEKCDLSFLQSKHPVFTSLALWNNSVNIGSDEWIGGSLPWVGVGNSLDFGLNWSDISNLGGSTPLKSTVYCMSTFSDFWNLPKRLIAGTDSGIFYVEDIDTGTWHPIQPQLEETKTRNLYVTTTTEGAVPEIFASTDEGIFVLSRRTGLNWMCSLMKKTYQVTSYTKAEPVKWFAGTEDGVYCLSFSSPIQTNSPEISKIPIKKMNTPQTVVNVQGEIRNPFSSPIILYLPNGRKVAVVKPKGVLYDMQSGIYVMKFCRF